MTNIKDRPTRKLGGGRSEPADYRIARFAFWPEPGTTLKELMHPQYFANYFDIFREGMELSVLSECKELDVRLRVMAFDRFQAHIRILDIYAAPDMDEYLASLEEGDTPTNDLDDDGVPEGMSVKFAGKHKWRIINDATGDVLEAHIASKGAAVQRAQELAI